MLQRQKMFPGSTPPSGSLSRARITVPTRGAVGETVTTPGSSTSVTLIVTAIWVEPLSSWAVTVTW